ncbi:hypothetical protein GCM10010329_49000 [Streptomyces spiroverticillatus]|uniref:PIN domain-containing protein n=1 Tax=Streptomyces finlayi TaxID=67296 RepID=A0A918X1E9_9ACTN|nr:hypothetical protein [Streptomyces finlayi]GHA20049.1 hypothetical protein GCM10010329_49000 [Streptomyces spiroverticillatus]GHD02876.1 hypothetical protein GCM10010334_49950 [Streptomyces finlayi]
MPELSYVLDCEALSRAARGDLAMRSRLKEARRSRIHVVTSSMTLIEAYHDKISAPAWSWTMSLIAVEPVTKEIADTAIQLLRQTGLHGHKYAIDAALAVIAGRQRGRVALFTSDEDDMTKLCPPTVRVMPL